MKNLKLLSLVAVLVIASLVLAACPQPEPQVVEKVVTQVVEVEKVVQQTVEVIKEVEKVVEQTVVVEEQVQVAMEDFSTPHPILSDLKVRQALAYCIDRDALIASVYPFVDDPETILMDSFLPKSHWAYKGPYPDLPQYDPEAGKALLDEAGWTLPEGAAVRQNAAGETLAIKFTTTSAQFRQTWGAVAQQNLADCGIQLITNFTPASWWFGDTTGLARRDFELGAYAWVGQADPSGRTLYACDQIPLPSNNWEGQNYMGWCNETASNAIIRANNTLIRDERIAAYDIVQQEFAKDVVSIPVFQRVEGEAWSNNLQGLVVDPTEYGTASGAAWSLADGGDTVITGLSQEPASMFSLVESAAVQRQVAQLGIGVVNTQYSYDFQPVLQDGLSTVESGLAANDIVEVKAGDTVYSIEGQPVVLEQGVKVFDADGNEVEYDGTSTLTMPQLTVTYKFKPYTWSDGTAGSIDDFKLGFQINCDRESGATEFNTCDTFGTEEDVMGNITFSDSALEYTIQYWPGVQDPTYFLAPFSISGQPLYPSHQVLADGRNLAEVPAAEWQTLPEIADTPLSFGPFVITEWAKGESITLQANPYYEPAPAITSVIVKIIPDTNQAVAQLLAGEVDYLEKATLGAGAEVQTVVDAAAQGNVQVELSASPTWEHIDINMFTK